MSALGRIIFRNVASNARKVTSISPVQGFRGLSTIIERKEMAEESRYIRKLEARRNDELKARMQKILELEDGSAEKKELLELLEKKEEPVEKKGLIAKLGLDDWKLAFPVSLLVVLPAIKTELFVLNDDATIGMIFILFCSTVYTQVGPMVAKTFEQYTKEIEQKMKSVDDAVLNQINAAVDTNEKNLTLKEDYESIFRFKDDLAATKAEALNLAEEHKFREAIIAKLDSLHALEEAASAAVRNRMVKEVHADVVKTFTNDKKAKESALQQAIAVLVSGEGSKIGKDVVGEAFVSALSNYRTNYSKLSPDQDEILVNLQKEMAAVTSAPTVDAKGGNIYNTI
eukprot:gene10770-11970_t